MPIVGANREAVQVPVSEQNSEEMPTNDEAPTNDQNSNNTETEGGCSWD